MNSPVSLGVSLADAPAPTGVFNQRFEALFPRAGTLVCLVSLATQLFLSVYLHANVGLSGLPATALPFILSALAAHLNPSYQSE